MAGLSDILASAKKKINDWTNFDDFKSAPGGIAEVQRNVDEYKNATAPRPVSPTPLIAPPTNDSGRRYGDRPGELRPEQMGFGAIRKPSANQYGTLKNSMVQAKQ